MEQENSIVVDCHAEFSIELVLAVPYAYWLHTHGLLKKTISVSDTKALYYFSPDHEEKYSFRTIDNVAAGLDRLPNNWIHHNPAVSNGKAGVLDFSSWMMPPYKSVYKNDIFEFDKPLLIVSNKYASEWGGPPINYIDIATLDTLFGILKDKYTVVYKRPRPKEYACDENELVRVGNIRSDVDGMGMITDYDLCKMHNVIDYSELLLNYPNLSYNTFQFLLFANCDNYISVQGGNSHICSLFGKININYIVKGKELRPGYFDESGWYYRMNKCNTLPVQSYTELIDAVKRYM